jgi:hypothetical protein
MGLGFPELVILLVIVFGMGLALAWPASRICKRAGFSPWLGVLIIVPLANIFLLWFVAFTPWPALPDNGQG